MKRAAIVPNVKPDQRIGALLGFNAPIGPIEQAITGDAEMIVSHGVGIAYKFNGEYFVYADEDQTPAINAHVNAAHDALMDAGYHVRAETTDYRNDVFWIYSRRQA
jgi:hypothetical protein